MKVRILGTRWIKLNKLSRSPAPSESALHVHERLLSIRGLGRAFPTAEKADPGSLPSFTRKCF